MVMNLWMALAIYILFLGGYWFFIWSIWWHIREYTLPQDQSRYVIGLFFVVAVVLSVLSFVLFFTLPLQT